MSASFLRYEGNVRASDVDPSASDQRLRQYSSRTTFVERAQRRREEGASSDTSFWRFRGTNS